MEHFKAGNVGKCALQSKSTMDKKKKRKEKKWNTHKKYGPQCSGSALKHNAFNRGFLRLKIDTVPLNQIMEHAQQSDLRQRAANWCKIRFDVNE